MFFLVHRVVLCFLLMLAAAPAQEMTVEARQVLLIDGETGTILFEKNADEVFNPSSMTKLLVAEVIFDALERNEISLDTLFKVSEQAWRKGGAPSRSTTMFASVNSLIPVGDLLRGLTVVQGNDAALILAEGLAGNEEDFIKRMNERARALGLTQTKIVDVTGLRGQNRSTVHDLLKLARHIEQHYPHYFVFYSEPAFEWNKIFQRNRHPLYQSVIGVDGFVASGVEGQGYGVVATVKQGKRRLFLALAGVEKARQRLTQAKKLIEWGMNEFETKLVYDSGQSVAQARIYGGVTSQIDLKTLSPVGILLPRRGTPRLKIRAVYHGPLIAPVEEGRFVGHLVISEQGRMLLEQPLVTAGSVAEAGLTRKAMDALFEVSIGWMRKYLSL